MINNGSAFKRYTGAPIQPPAQQETRKSAFRPVSNSSGVSSQISRQNLDAQTRTTLAVRPTFSPIVVSGQSTASSQPLSDRVTPVSTTSLNLFSSPSVSPPSQSPFPFFSPSSPVYMPLMQGPLFPPFNPTITPYFSSPQVSLPPIPMTFPSLPLIPAPPLDRATEVRDALRTIPTQVSAPPSSLTQTPAKQRAASKRRSYPSRIKMNEDRNLNRVTIFKLIKRLNELESRIQKGELNDKRDEFNGSIVLFLENFFKHLRFPLSSEHFSYFERALMQMGKTYKLFYQKLAIKPAFHEFIKEGREAIASAVTKFFPESKDTQNYLISLLERSATE